MRSLVTACVAAAVSTACATTAPRTDAGGLLDPTPRVAIATAYAPELSALRRHLNGDGEHQVNGVTFWTGAVSGVDVVVFKTGVGLVNAAMNTQLVLERFAVEEIVVAGVAGGVDPTLSVGDVTVPARWAQYDRAIYLREDQDGVAAPPAWVSPEVEPFRFILPRGTRIARADDPEPARQLWFPASPRLLDLAAAAAQATDFERCTAEGECLDATPRAVVGGAGASGSAFVDNEAVRDYLFATFDADVVEMETASIAMVAHANDTPFIAFRSLSDLAGGDAGANQIRVYEALASTNTARLVEAFLAERAKTWGS